jgi:hypothetical protein
VNGMLVPSLLRAQLYRNLGVTVGNGKGTLLALSR